MNKPGDWNCRSCQHLNFQRRDSCQRCGYSRPGDRGHYSGGSSFRFTTSLDVRPGGWYCSIRNCGAHNFASRSSCFKCGPLKEEADGGGFDDEFSWARGFGFGGAAGGGGGRSGRKSGH